MAVGVIERSGHLRGDLHRACRAQRASSGEQLPQGLAPHELHDDVHEAAVNAGVEDGDNVGVGEPSGGYRFAAEALEERGVLGQVWMQHLDRDRSVEDLVVRLPHLCHAATRDEPDEAVATAENSLGDERCVGHRATVPRAGGRLHAGEVVSQSCCRPDPSHGAPRGCR